MQRRVCPNSGRGPAQISSMLNGQKRHPGGVPILKRLLDKCCLRPTARSGRACRHPFAARGADPGRRRMPEDHDVTESFCKSHPHPPPRATPKAGGRAWAARRQ